MGFLRYAFIKLRNNPKKYFGNPRKYARWACVHHVRLLHGWLRALAFVLNSSGKDYRIGLGDKVRLVHRIRRILKLPRCGTTFEQHLLLVEEIFRLPRSVEGDVVECGCWKGASTCSLSLACHLTGRRLFICDSFEGLPEPEDQDQLVPLLNGHYDAWNESETPGCYVWTKGEYEGSLDEVTKNVKELGSIESCRFVKGYFNDTLPNIETDSIVLVFEDADIAGSVRDCLEFLWPKMRFGAKVFCHEPWSIDVVSLFYDKSWWQEKMNSGPPGFCGAGAGIRIGMMNSNIGYAQKIDLDKIKRSGSRFVSERLLESYRERIG